MTIQVVSTAGLMCTFGLSPGTLTVLPQNEVQGSALPAATVLDCIPITNISTFGMCASIANPAVASATAAALGVLTPMPCVPVTSPWTPGASQVLIGSQPALDDSSTCNCAWAGVITIVSPGQVLVTVT